MNAGRFIQFLIVVLSIWGLVHLYVFWRLSSIPWIATHVSRKLILCSGILLWLSYILARWIGSWSIAAVAYPLEFAASTWMGLVFLLFALLLVVDVATLGGALFSTLTPHVRGGAAAVALLLGAVAVVQALRPPVVTRHEVVLDSLPAQQDGTTLVAVTDLHLGRLLGERWLNKRIAQINALQPDGVVAVGDVVDGSAHHVRPLIPTLAQLQAPLGVWAVTGNHEFYVGVEHSMQLLAEAGWRVLRDQSSEVVSGLVFAGVDDLTARPSSGDEGHPIDRTLRDRPAGATVLLSHSPMEAERAAALGAQLMLSGHTHAGQIWPFNHLVGLRYRWVSGRYDVDGMPLIVCRGTGTWGPRMRLWKPSEILHITLRSPTESIKP